MLRIGVAVGEVITDTGDYFGTPVVEAAGSARPPMAADSRERAGAWSRAHRVEHVFTGAGIRVLKGLPPPIAMYTLAWRDRAIAVCQLSRPLSVTHRLALAGRSGELERLRRTWG